MRRLRSARPSPALLVALLAVFVAVASYVAFKPSKSAGRAVTGGTLVTLPRTGIFHITATEGQRPRGVSGPHSTEEWIERTADGTTRTRSLKRSANGRLEAVLTSVTHAGTGRMCYRDYTLPPGTPHRITCNTITGAPADPDWMLEPFALRRRLQQPGVHVQRTTFLGKPAYTLTLPRTSGQIIIDAGSYQPEEFRYLSPRLVVRIDTFEQLPITSANERLLGITPRGGTRR